jgi:hypothetical protein
MNQVFFDSMTLGERSVSGSTPLTTTESNRLEPFTKQRANYVNEMLQEA